MATAAIWKITKIVISLQRFDRSVQNLVRWCKMGLLIARPLKIEFHKSKMADGRRFKNSYIILSQQPFDWFLFNLAWWCMLVPRAWRKFQIFNFLQSYTADRRYLANRKTVLMYCVYTMTHSTILTIKQQILILTRSSAIAEGPRDASFKSCQLPRHSVETNYTTSPDQIDDMKLEI